MRSPRRQRGKDSGLAGCGQVAAAGSDNSTGEARSRSMRAAGLRVRGAQTTYGMMGGMEKTTVYLTESQKRALSQAAKVSGRSEAELIREGIDTVTSKHAV